jgi:hypothetical protein
MYYTRVGGCTNVSETQRKKKTALHAPLTPPQMFFSFSWSASSATGSTVSAGKGVGVGAFFYHFSSNVVVLYSRAALYQLHGQHRSPLLTWCCSGSRQTNYRYLLFYSDPTTPLQYIVYCLLCCFIQTPPLYSLLLFIVWFSPSGQIVPTPLSSILHNPDKFQYPVNIPIIQ